VFNVTPTNKKGFSAMLLSHSEQYKIHLGDCIPHMADMPAASVDMSVFSPPFPALYAYTSSESDIGNSEDLDHEAKLHLSFFYRQLARVLKPGRVAVVHVMQIPRMKRSGGVGLFDFRGLNIRIGQRSGLIYEYDWSVRKNPQAQAIRTKSRELQFAGLESDRAKSRGALPDYLIKFRAPGENTVAIDSESQVSRNEWIQWAECCWMDIRETDTLNVREGRSEDDVKHICPLQLGVIDRLVRLYSNPGEIVFSPFTGIGSEAHEALRNNRRFYGCELKPEYHATAIRNCERAIASRQGDGSQMTICDMLTAVNAA
jgi:DNA modification methylase